MQQIDKQEKTKKHRQINTHRHKQQYVGYQKEEVIKGGAVGQIYGNK